MRVTRHSEEQTTAIPKQADDGVKTSELCRHHGISEQTLYRWKAKCSGMEVSDSVILDRIRLFA